MGIVGNCHWERNCAHLSARFMGKQQDLLDNPVQVRTVRTDKGIEISFLLLNKLVEDFPRTFDDFHLTVRLGLADEVNHFCHNEANLVPLETQICDRTIPQSV